MVRSLAIVVALAQLAHADSGKLAEARQAVDAVRYDDAQKLLLAALQEGGNSPAAVAEIYKLAASTAIVLGQRDVAEQYYRRWIAIDPHAELPDTLAPKLREPFVAAQAYMAAHGQLVITVTRHSATDVEVAVDSDPLTMVAAVAIDPAQPVRLGVDHRTHLAAHAGALTLSVLDAQGNRLRELPVVDAVAPATTKPEVPVQTEPVRPTPTGTPWYRDWRVYAVPGAACLAVGLGFGRAAQNADTDLGSILAMHVFYDDARAAQARRDRDASIANGLFVGALALGATAAIMYVWRPHEAVTPIAAPGMVGAALSGAW